MKRYTYLIVFCTLVLCLGLIAGVIPRTQALAQEDSPNEPQIQQATIGTAITYQGHLEKDGSPINGNCDFAFVLYDAETNGNTKGSQSLTASISDGYFSVPLDFGVTAFQGEARWLEIFVRCPSAVGSYSQLSGRTLLTAAPYALGLKPGAAVKDTSASLTPVYGQSGSDWNLPLSIALMKAGLWGDGRYDNGVIGTSQTGNGLYGYSESGMAIYADGDAYVDGDLTWKAKTNYLSVPAAEFRPYTDVNSYMNSGTRLTSFDDYGTYFAPVYLPQGAVVTQVTWYYDDPMDPQSSECDLFRSHFNGDREWMSQVYTEGSAGDGSKYDDSISYAEIDNSQYAYYLEWVGHYDAGESIDLYGVVIEYTTTH